ncbi:lipopolysaccharide assembly protein LapB [uncultured Muribaculum sp.]|uniref:tetratricopeptide repeat protein n=1 Tax=uncultured Muribaculum sp. TaxID=1918613 RepID=UPI002674DE34|nr:tetratricopeptide repeat protein [uncultured Muribaculum sp.]
MKHLLLIIVAVVCIAVVAGCADNSRLRDDIDRAGRLADTCPDSAIALLDSLSPAINQADKATRMRYDLMLIKSRDKAYIEHRNDSMIAPVVEYFTGHSDPDLTPLALYYAGRVYSDLGDVPRALDYFQQAVNAIGDDTIKRYGLYKVCHSQIAELFMHQHLFNYALNSAIKAVDLSSPETLHWDYEMIACIYYEIGTIDSSLTYYKRAYDSALKNNPAGISRVKQQMASFFYHCGEYSKADSILSTLMTNYPADLKNQVYSTKASNTIKIEGYEAAFPYLKWLADSGNIYGQTYGNGELANYYSYIAEKYDAAEKYDSAAMHLRSYIKLQDSINKITQIEAVEKVKGMYDYSIREKDNKILRTENRLRRELNVALAFILAAVVFIGWILFRDSNRKRMVLRYKNIALKSILDDTRKSTKEYQQEMQDKVDSLTKQLDVIDSVKATATELAIKKSEILLSDSILTVEERAQQYIRLLEKPVISYLKNGLTKGESLNTTKALVELEKCVNDIYPEFKHKLISICGVNITEYNVSLLLKSGFSPSEISKLLSKSNETISSIRRRLMKKVFNQKNASPKLWDEFISSL